MTELGGVARDDPSNLSNYVLGHFVVPGATGGAVRGQGACLQRTSRHITSDKSRHRATQPQAN